MDIAAIENPIDEWEHVQTSSDMFTDSSDILNSGMERADCMDIVLNNVEQSDNSWNSTPMPQDRLDSLFTDDCLSQDNQVVSLVHASSATLIKEENSTSCTFLCNHCGEKASDLSTFAQHVCILSGDGGPCSIVTEDPSLNIQPPGDVMSTEMLPAQLLTFPTTFIAFTSPEIPPPTLIAAPSPPEPPALVASPKFRKIMKKTSAIITVNEQPSSSAKPTVSERGFICQLCGKSYTSANGLIIHERRHAGERPYPCQYCSKSFPDSSSCSRHERIHTGERPYVCEFCGRAFNDSSHLVTHRRKHTGERPYPCTKCPKAFFKSSDLKRHLRTHLSERHFPCGQCQKSFKEAAALARHERIHTELRPFSCETCGRAFFDKSSFLRHQRTHSEERSWTCDVCSKGFKDVTSLKRHQRTKCGGVSA